MNHRPDTAIREQHLNLPSRTSHAAASNRLLNCAHPVDVVDGDAFR
jgi:hypothetical protein